MMSAKRNLASISDEALDALTKAAEENHPISNLEELGVNQRMINLLQLNGINDMNELMNKSRDQLMSIQNFGEKQLFVLFEAMSKYHSLPDF